MINFTSNIDEIVERFKITVEKAKQTDFSDALLVGVNAAKGRMQNRIFTEGLDAGKVPIGSYGGKKKVASLKLLEGRNKEFLVGDVKTLLLSAYERKRLAAGRQIRFKDLEFTGALRRGIVVIKESQIRVICAIPNEDLFKISQYQEEYIGAKIFELSDEERTILKENTIEAVKQMYVRIFNP